MIQALLLIARWIAEAQVRAFVGLALRRPLAAEIAVLRERLDRVTAERGPLRQNERTAFSYSLVSMPTVEKVVAPA